MGVALTACSAPPAASPVAIASPAISLATPAPATATPQPTVIPSPVPSETAAPTANDSAEPRESAKPLPSIDQATLDALFTSSITLLNLADADLAVTVLYRESKGETPFPLGSYALAFTDQQTYEVPAGIYDLQFAQPAGSTAGPSCTIELDDADAYTFVAIDGAVAIGRAGDAPTDARELFVATSSLCVD